ncbi:MAG: hypothetical protein AB7V13_00455 [Pseudorhodoplanes sp.]|uniref:hypothetical protein n=1 Tax=Pseudorhodoplanes sp. TaxID=1934341 RepID=UPI003D0B5724
MARIRFIMMMTALAFAGLAVPLPVQAQSDTAQPGWRTYVDERTGTRVDFPATLFPVEAAEPERGVGRVFNSSDGRATFSAYALDNEEGHTPQSYLRNFLKVDPRTIDYRRVTRRFFAVSGVRDGEVYYSRCNFHGRMHCIYLSYPERELRAWDGIVTRISLSLRGPRNASARR